MVRAASFPSPVVRERLKEDERMKLSPPDLGIDIIRYTHVYFDKDGDFVVEFGNSKDAFGLLVELDDHKALGLRDAQALSECVKIGTRGSEINCTTFIEHCEILRFRFASTSGPMYENKRLMFLVNPGRSELKSRNDATVQRLSLSFDLDYDLMFTAHTYGAHAFAVLLALPSEEKSLCSADCHAFFDIMYYLEPGNCLNLRTFLCTLSTLREKYNFLTLGNHKGVITCLIHASSMKNPQPEYAAIRAAVDEQKRIDHEAKQKAQIAHEAAAAAHMGHGPAGHALVVAPAAFPGPGVPISPNGAVPVESVDLGPLSLPPCPYPNMWYTRALQKSGQAQVYAGETVNGQRVAIKVFSGATHNAAVTYRLELRMLLKMPEHRNVISVLEFFENPQPALVMHYIEGVGDMFEYLRNHGPIEESEARRIAAELADGVAHLHRSRIVHRDLKSANILLRTSSASGALTPVIIDLGLGGAIQKGGRTANASTLEMISMEELAQSLAETQILKQTVSTKGSALWMSPEMFMQRQWSEKTDVFAFGIILWEMLSGDVPYSHLKIQSPMDLLFRVGNGARPDMRRIAHAPVDLQELVTHCWERHPRDRPTMTQVMDRLRGSDPQAIFKGLDTDGSRSLSFFELVTFLGKYAPHVSPDETLRIFNSIDQDDSGDITVDEFSKFWKVVQNQGLQNALMYYKQRREGQKSGL